jgi:hypothetical protein
VPALARRARALARIEQLHQPLRDRTERRIDASLGALPIRFLAQQRLLLGVALGDEPVPLTGELRVGRVTVDLHRRRIDLLGRADHRIGLRQDRAAGARCVVGDRGTGLGGDGVEARQGLVAHRCATVSGVRAPSCQRARDHGEHDERSRMMPAPRRLCGNMPHDTRIGTRSTKAEHPVHAGCAATIRACDAVTTIGPVIRSSSDGESTT